MQATLGAMGTLAHTHTRTLPPSPHWLPSRPRSSGSRFARRNSSNEHRRAARSMKLVASSSNGTSANGASDKGVEVENVVIIGSGPAGYTAAIYAARANLRPLVFEGVQKGGVRGGQLMTTTEVENFPGFPEGITGPDLMDRMRQQAERWGARLLTEDVESLDLSARPFTVAGDETSARAHAVIVATGATAKRLGIPSEDRFWSAGISACAICDGASPIFKGQALAVVGGGDTATEEALYLTKYASHVHLLVRGERMRASKAMQDRVLAHPKVTVHFNTGVEDAYGQTMMEGLHLLDTKTGEKRDLPVHGLFYGIGHKPNSELVAGQVALDEAGYVAVQGGCRTSVEGVFSAGDLHDTEWRQAITAAGSGCMAALAAERYLAEHGLLQEFHQEEQPASSSAAAATEQPSSSSSSSSSSSNNGGLTPEQEFNLAVDKHQGQYALRKLYHESDRVLAVLYTAPTCGPCRTLKPILNKVVDEYAGRIHYVEIDIDADPAIAEAAGVNGTPTVQFFKNKDRVAVLPGVKMKKDYRAAIEAHLG